MSDYVWQPSAADIEPANVTRLARRLGVEGFDALHARSIADIDAFWEAVVHDLDVPFLTPYAHVHVRGAQPWQSRWFEGGQMNVAHACCERWADDPAHAQRIAIVAEGEDGTLRDLTYAELRREVARLAEGLSELGVESGDAVGLCMPMVPEAVIGFLAIASLGAMIVPIFSGFAAGAIATRLQDARAVALLTADGFARRGRIIAAKSVADEAADACPTVRNVVVLRQTGSEVAWRDGRDVWWHELVDGRPGTRRAAALDPEHLLMLAYTSGTTGQPKGVMHTHGGFLVKMAAESAYECDQRDGERVTWISDMGWIMGPKILVGTLALGGTFVQYDGAPDYPDASRIWRMAERTRTSFLGVSPTLVRALKQHGDEHATAADLSALRLFGSTGEPWNSDPYLWLFHTVGRGTRPIVNISGGTEVVVLLASTHVLPHKPCTLGRPALGMDVDVFDAAGRSLRGELGELVCKQPWPSMARGIWGDEERYLESYWRTYPGVWRHGDWASIDGDGDWFLHGRSDDTLNVAGKRIGPAEYESALVADPAVVEACAIGVPHAIKGEVVVCFAVLAAGHEPTDELRARLRERCAAELGKAFAPAEVRFTTALPKTRSAKIVRRAVRATVLDEDPGDLSTLEDRAALTAIAQAR